jgi:hypothetical protein
MNKIRINPFICVINAILLLSCSRQIVDPSGTVHGPIYTEEVSVEDVLRGYRDVSSVTINGNEFVLEMQPGFPIQHICISRKGESGYEVRVAKNDTVYAYKRTAINMWFADKLCGNKAVYTSVIDLSGNYSSLFDEAAPDVKEYLFNMVVLLHRRPKKEGVFVYPERIRAGKK